MSTLCTYSALLSWRVRTFCCVATIFCEARPPCISQHNNARSPDVSFSFVSKSSGFPPALHPPGTPQFLDPLGPPRETTRPGNKQELAWQKKVELRQKQEGRRHRQEALKQLLPLSTSSAQSRWRLTTGDLQENRLRQRVSCSQLVARSPIPVLDGLNMLKRRVYRSVTTRCSADVAP